jgi:hypothetical protein
MAEATADGLLLSVACVSLGGRPGSNQSDNHSCWFFPLSIALEITRGAGEPELVRGGFSLVPDAPFGV